MDKVSKLEETRPSYPDVDWYTDIGDWLRDAKILNKKKPESKLTQYSSGHWSLEVLANAKTAKGFSVKLHSRIGDYGEFVDGRGYLSKSMI